MHGNIIKTKASVVVMMMMMMMMMDDDDRRRCWVSRVVNHLLCEVIK